MKTESHSKGPEHGSPHAPPAGSPLRLIILLSVLVVVGGALLYDWVIAPPRVEAANNKLLDSILEFNKTGRKPTGIKGPVKGESTPVGKPDGMLYSEDIQEILGMAPTKVEKADLYTIEHYCWWGWIPRNRNYITVLYVGPPKKPHYSTHYANEMPEDGVVPGKTKFEASPVDLASDKKNATGAIPAGGPGAGAPAGMAPPMMGPGMGGPGMGGPGGGGGRGKGGGGGKGKGRPQGNADKGSEAKGAEDGTKKSAEPNKNDEPAKAEEPKKKAASEGDNKEPAKEAPKESK